MHLTPDQIDRQPFRMRRRGYDILQVRNFLREIAREMRERQHVREQLAREGDPDEVASDRALGIVREAEERAARIVADAEAAVDRGDVDRARRHADEIVAEAEAEAARIIEQAEQAARHRSDQVLSETQRRLDGLLQQEREILARIADAEARVGERTEVIDEPAAPAAEDAGPDSSSLAEFMKSALREEL